MLTTVLSGPVAGSTVERDIDCLNIYTLVVRIRQRLLVRRAVRIDTDKSMFTHVSTLANCKHQQSVTKVHNDSKQNTFHFIVSSIAILPGRIWPMFRLFTLT